MLFKSQVYTQTSGSIGGTTYSHNRYGMYTRGRTVPVNPNTDRQAGARNRLSQLASYWLSTLTAAERAAWNLYGSSVVMKNALGDDIYLSGFSHFLRSNCQALQVGNSIVEPGPTVFTLPETDSAIVPSVSEATQQISLAFDTNLDWVDEDNGFLQVSMSSPKGAGRSFIGGPFRYAGSISGDSTTPPTSPQVIAVPFAVTEGQLVQVQCRIGREDGRLSEPFSANASVAS
jgi:hypothetical protein